MIIVFFQYVKEEPGNFIDWDTGKILGRHQGVHHWTLGQRCHLGGHNQAYFVFRKLENHNILVVRIVLKIKRS